MTQNMPSTEHAITCLRDALHDHGHKNIELEFRLGKCVNGSFVSGIPKPAFETLFAILAASPAFRRHDVTTLEKLNGTDARFIITNGDEAHGRWCYKKKIWTMPIDTTLHGGRMAISLEGHDHSPPPPGSPPFKYHRRKQRTSFVHDCWSFDLTRVTSNLPGHFDNDEEIFEVEIELIDTDAFFVYTLEHLVSWGIHLLHEIHGLLVKKN